MRRIRLILAATGLLVAGGLAAGVLLRDNAGLTTKRSIPAPAQMDLVPNFSDRLADGSPFTSGDIQGPAIIHVYASWCAVCKSEALEITRLQRERPDFEWYFVAVDDDVDAARAFAQRFGWTDGPLIDDQDRSVPSAFGLVGQPHSIFIDASGRYVVHQGGSTFEQLDELAERIT